MSKSSVADNTCEDSPNAFAMIAMRPVDIDQQLKLVKNTKTAANYSDTLQVYNCDKCQTPSYYTDSMQQNYAMLVGLGLPVLRVCFACGIDVGLSASKQYDSNMYENSFQQLTERFESC
jgi:hypothetical protein